MSELELDGPFSFSYAWGRAAISHSLHHINIYGTEKRHGFATLMFFVCVLVSFQYAYVEYLDGSSAYLMAIDKVDELSVDMACSAVSCYFYQEKECDDARALTDGQNTTIAASDCRWTVKIVTNASFESKRTAIGLLTRVDNETSREYFAAVEQETLKFVSLSKTVDETYSPPFETWAAQVFSTYDYYRDCAAYQDNAEQTCGAFQISFDNKVYTITVNNQVGFIIVLSTGMISSVVFWVLLKLAMYNFDAGSTMHLWLDPKRE